MGYYINTNDGRLHNKAAWLVEKCGGEVISKAEADRRIENPEVGIICVVNNGPFEACAFAYSKEEYEAFNYQSDSRAKVWVAMDRELAETLSGYKGA